MSQEKLFHKMFAHRSTVCFFVMAVLLLSCVLRIAEISTGDYSAVQARQSSYRIDMPRQRGTVFDCNMIPLTNSESYTVAAVSPTATAAVGLRSACKGEVPESVGKSLALGKPAVCEVKKQICADGISYATLYRNTSGMPATHIIGYTDSSGHGVSGLQKAYDSLLYFKETPSACFTVGGNGDVLAGVSPEILSVDMPYSTGVVSTVDINIQNIAEKAMDGIECGAALVAEAKTGKIRASVSRPVFDTLNIAESLKKDNSPFLDRTLAPFSVGSVFKLCVAAAALENGKGDFIFNCTGSTFIIDREFNCHKHDGHGVVDLRHAIAFSCNTFFYNFAQEIGAEKIYKTASALSFGSRLMIADGIYSAKGNLTELKNLNSAARLANLSIGQGDLLLSPVAMLTLYTAIANGGEYYVPSLVEGTVKDGKYTFYDSGSPTRAMSKSTADTLLDYLSSVLTEGTGSAAMPKLTDAAGKTATAQTGRYYENGTEITNSWFCGMFPKSVPEYVVIVMSDKASSHPVASVFSEIADGVTELKN